MRKCTVLVVSVLASIILPMAVGGMRGIGLSSAADGNQTFPFSEAYHKDVTLGFDQYLADRSSFSFTGHNQYGLKTHGRSVCQESLWRNSAVEDNQITLALSYQRSSVLEQIFDRPGVKAIEALPSTLTGALQGCRYTILAFACDAAARKAIVSANRDNTAALEQEKREWLKINEAASCKAFTKLGPSQPDI